MRVRDEFTMRRDTSLHLRNLEAWAPLAPTNVERQRDASLVEGCGLQIVEARRYGLKLRTQEKLNGRHLTEMQGSVGVSRMGQLFSILCMVHSM